MEKCGKVWKRVETYGKMLKIVEKLEKFGSRNIWKQVEKCGEVLKSVEKVWKSMEKCGKV